MSWSHTSRVADGARIHWNELGTTERGGDVPLVLLHGLHDSSVTWTPIADKLAQRRRVLMPDLLGCGLSDRPDASYALEWHAQVIADWLRAIGVRRCDVVGHSFGGGVAQMLLLERKLEVRRLALLASGGLGRDVGVWLRLAALSSVVEHYGQPFMSLGTRLALLAMNGPRTPQHLEDLMAANGREGSARAFARTVRDVIDWRGQKRLFFQRAHELRVLPAIAVCWGDRDAVLPISQATAFVEALSNVRLHPFEGAGHYLHHDRPDELVDLLNTFLTAKYVQRAELRERARGPAGARAAVRGLVPELA